MTKVITPTLGVNLAYNSTSPPYHDAVWGDVPTPALGTMVKGEDGHDYLFVQTGGSAIDAGDDVTVNESTWVATEPGEGTGPWVLTANAEAASYIWVKRTLL